MTAKKGKKSKRWIILAVIAVIIIGGAIIIQPLLLSRLGDNLANIKTVEATIGSISKTISGSGNLRADETRHQVSVISGLSVDEVLVEPGDEVTSGSIIATFDHTALQQTIWDIQGQIETMDRQINLLADKTESRYITSGVSGRVKYVVAETGEVDSLVIENHYLALLSLDGKMTVRFRPDSFDESLLGSEVTVRVNDELEIEGEIVSTDSLQGMYTVTLSDKEAPYGEDVEILLEDDSKLGVGSLQISQPMTITATDGVIADILVEAGDWVNRSTRLFELESAPESEAYLGLLAQREDLAKRLEALLVYARDGGLISGYLGTVETVAINDGQMTVGMACTVLEQGETYLGINIDELDVTQLAYNLPALISVDALPDQTFDGEVAEIDNQGIIGQGGTSFPVTVEFDQPVSNSGQTLLIGMSATAVITVTSRHDVVLIPLEALQEAGGETFVYVGEATGSDNLGERRVVKIGISDGQNVEIIEGVADSESINYYYNDGSSEYWFAGRPGANAAGQTE